MKNISVLLMLLTALSGAAVLRTHQVGYFPTGPKVAVAVDAVADSFLVRNLTTDSVVLRGRLGNAAFWAAGREMARLADFSAVEAEGYFRLEIPGETFSHPFRIAEDLYVTPFYHVLRSFYFQRASTEIPEEFGGVFARSFGHADTSLRYHEDLERPESARRDSPKGWYDAGDYGKYVVNAGVTMGWLQLLALQWPGLVPDGFSNIPESGSGISDFLDEMRWELDWLFTMQDTNGSVFFKVTPKNFEGTVMPAPNGTRERLIIGGGTSAALNFSAIMAQASRVWRSVDSAFADSCVKVAERAWTWAVANPQLPYTQGTAGRPYADVRTGGYGDSRFTDEFFWAGVELYLTTGKAAYKTRLTTEMPSSVGTASWGNPSPIGMYSLALWGNQRDSALASTARQRVLTRADALRDQVAADAYRFYNTGFYWGSNGGIAGDAGHLVLAHTLTGERAYLNAAVHISDYFFGKNPLGFSYISGMGFHSMQRPHSRIMEPDGVDEPIPGYIAGGANESPANGDNALTAVQNTGCAPAACYVDVYSSYAANEIAINWQAPLLFVLGALQAEVGTSTELERTSYDRVQLAVLPMGPGEVAVDPYQPSYMIGDTVILRARAAAGAVFASWGAGLSGNDTAITLVMERNTQVRAYFIEPGAEIIRNGNFIDSLDYWALTPFGHFGNVYAEGSLALDEGAGRITPMFPGTQSAHVALLQGPFFLSQGQSYTLTFKAKSSEYRPGYLSIRQGNRSYLARAIEFGPDWERYRVSFAVDPMPSTDQALLRIEVGGNPAPVWLDSISLRSVVGSTPNDVLSLHTPAFQGPGALHLRQIGNTVAISGGSGWARLHLLGADGRVRHSTRLQLASGGSSFALPLTGLHLLVVEPEAGTRQTLWVANP